MGPCWKFLQILEMAEYIGEKLEFLLLLGH
jgi:hypothetical protein